MKIGHLGGDLAYLSFSIQWQFFCAEEETQIECYTLSIESLPMKTGFMCGIKVGATVDILYS